MRQKWIPLRVVVMACCLLSLASQTEAGDGVLGCCPDAGCTKTVCRPVVETKTVTKRVYSDVKEEFCLPCSAFSCLFPNKCGCSHVHTKKILVVKLRKNDKCVTKCHPVAEPVCAAPCTVAPCAPACQPAAPVGQPGVIAIPVATSLTVNPVALPTGK